MTCSKWPRVKKRQDSCNIERIYVGCSLDFHLGGIGCYGWQ